MSEGDNLARVLVYNYLHPDTVFCSTGIFDVEAANSDIVNGILGGVGILRSFDGGETWHTANKGIDNLYLGFLDMHPTNPDILFAAASNNATSYPPNNSLGGIYKTSDGGDNWDKVLAKGETHNAVAVSKSNPDIVYAIGTNVNRSDDGGDTWRKINTEGPWGPPGIYPGFVISAVVDPDDPDIVWVNNYGGGSFVTYDGGNTWRNSSNGYTGAQLRDIASIPSNPNVCYIASRTGPFATYNGGEDWIGINYQNSLGECYTIEVFPDNPNEILASVDWSGAMQKSKDGGLSWDVVFQHPDVGGNPDSRHGFRDIKIAPSNNNIVYAGMGKVINVGMIDPSPEPSYGMYKSTDRGETWTQINQGLAYSGKTINSIAIHPHNPDIVYVGTYIDGIYKTIDGGLNWIMVNDGLHSSDIRSIAIDPFHPDTIYAGSGNGKGLSITYNGGELWGSINKGIPLVCPTYLSSYGEAVLGMDLTKPPITNNTINYTVPWTKIMDIVIDPTNAKNIYAADLSSGVLFSKDHGANWANITEGMGIKAITCLSISTKGNVLYCGSEGGGVYRIALENIVPNIYSRIPYSDTITVYRGESADFEIMSSDINNDTLEYSWYIEGDIIESEKGSQLTINTNPYSPGYYNIKIQVNDKDTMTQTKWTLQIIDLPSNVAPPLVEDILQVYPNPFKSALYIDYHLENPANLYISIIDLQARVIEILCNEKLPSGKHTFSWQPSYSQNYNIPEGIYIVKLLVLRENQKEIHERKIFKME